MRSYCIHIGMMNCCNIAHTRVDFLGWRLLLDLVVLDQFYQLLVFLNRDYIALCSLCSELRVDKWTIWITSYHRLRPESWIYFEFSFVLLTRCDVLGSLNLRLLLLLLLLIIIFD
jgi:hypothetical protein